MGRVGETVRRAFQCAAVMKAQRGAEPGPADNERVLRYLAKVTINPAVTHGLAADVGSLQVGRLADLVLWRPALFPVRPELVLKAGMPALGRVRRRRRVHDDGRAGARLTADRGHRRGARARLARLPRRRGDGRRPAHHARACAGGRAAATSPPPTWCETAARARSRSTPRPHREPRRRAAHLRAGRRGALLGPLSAVKIFHLRRAAIAVDSRTVSRRAGGRQMRRQDSRWSWPRPRWHVWRRRPWQRRTTSGRATRSRGR